jgi:hypothetical protein
VEVYDVDMEKLSEEAIRLLWMETDDLYAALGGQLLGHSLPTRAAGIVTYLSRVRRVSGPGLTELGEGLNIIYEELRRDGIRFLTEASGDLGDVLCSEEILRLTDQVTTSSMRIIILLVGSALKLRQQFDPIAATVAAIILKLGLRDFCLK